MCAGDYIVVIGAGAVGDVVDTMSKGHKKGWIKPNEKPMRVPCQTFKQLFSKYGIQHVDIFALH